MIFKFKQRSGCESGKKNMHIHQNLVKSILIKKELLNSDTKQFVNSAKFYTQFKTKLSIIYTPCFRPDGLKTIPIEQPHTTV